MGPQNSNDKKPNENSYLVSSNLKTILHNFAGETTAHGFAQLINTKWVLLKLFWIIGIAACYVFIILQVKTLIVRYNKKPVTTTVYTVTEHAPFFPVVVICNKNMIKREKTGKLLQEIQRVNKENNQNITEEISHTSIAQLVQIIKQKIFEYGEQFEDFIEECKLFKVHPCKTEKAWERVWLPHYGSCFVFNDIQHINETLRPIERVAGASHYDSLELNLNISQQQYLKDIGAGVRMFVGDQGSFYKPLENGFSLSPGFAYDIQLSKIKNIRVDPFKNNSCISASNVSFYDLGEKLCKKYDAKLCALKCYSEEMEKNCNCTRYDLPKIYNWSRICNLTDHNCYEKVKTRYVDGHMKCLKSCHPQCHESNYRADISFLKYPNTASAEKYGKPIAEVREEILQLKIYFKSLNVRITEEKMTYEMEDLLSNIGGQLGLFSGFSVLTIIELFCLAVTIATYFAKKL